MVRVRVCVCVCVCVLGGCAVSIVNIARINGRAGAITCILLSYPGFYQGVVATPWSRHSAGQS